VSDPAAVVPPPGDPADRREALHCSLAHFPAALFQFDPRLADGWFADRYFVRTAETLAHAGRDPIVRMQLFAKKHGILAGVYEAIRLLQTQLRPHPATGHRWTLHDLEVRTLMDGDALAPEDTVMHIVGPYLAFAHLETAYLGVLADRTLVSTNVRRAIEAAHGKSVIFMAARHGDWRRQTPDGYAALVGGAASVSSDANGAWWGARGVGTMPHSIIAAFGGDTVEATLAFTRYVRDREPDVNVVSLVDYHNDVVGDSLAVARAMRDAFGPSALWGVRVDTSERLVDRALQGREGEFPGEKLTGVNPPLIRELRRALDEAGFGDVKIGVSGGFTPRKILRFEVERVPVDFYGVGSSLLGHNNGEVDGLVNNFDFTADIVEVDGREEHKVGRPRRDDPRLITLDADHLDALDREAQQR
jgi:nicotinate phosphoribosyltransferase